MTRKARLPEELAPSDDFAAALNGESALACVLIGAAALEQSVMSLLFKHFAVGETSTKLFATNGILGDVSKCSKIAYCLGLLHKKVYQNLERVGTIRNLFAHSHVSIDFSNPDVKKECEDLSPPSIASVADPDFKEFKNALKDARFKFTVCAAMMRSSILLAAKSEKHREESPMPC
jgi:DNA-binding MltR family transcriptional regulator